ncbi:MAG: NADH-quinone oxidoreductase subunit A [Candidatus Bathyarchaeota archaeon]|nr:NADH-quinone oxidoreductase subunit A [Candidatus Bathyarchaeota archaeon]
MIIESIVAFVLITSAASLVYLLGRRAAPKPAQSDAERSAYACGENITFPKLRVNVSLYRYLIYFVVLDSSVLLLAFASFMGAGVNVPLILLYLFIMLAAGLLLIDGGKEEYD